MNDGIDSANGDNEIMPFKSVINEYYARDISKKIRSARKTLMQNGKYTANVSPLGYLKDPNDKHKLIIEERGANLVRYIFSLAVSGLGTGKIATRLNNERIPTIRQMWHEVNPDVTWNWHYNPEVPPSWGAGTVRSILVNKTYIGTFVAHKVQTKSFKNRNIIRIPESEWIEIPNVHPAIIDEETFKLAQRVLQIKQRKNNQKNENIYVGFLKCSDCGTNLSLTGGDIRGFMCNRYRGKSTNCTAHYVSEKFLQQALFKSIRELAKTAKNYEQDYIEYAAKLAEDGNRLLKQAEPELTSLNKRNAELDTIIERMYEDYVLGTITVGRYQSMSAKYEQEQIQVRGRLAALNQSLSERETEFGESQKFLQLIRKYTDIKEITRPLLVELIDKIVIHNATGRGNNRDQSIDIYYRLSGLVDSKN